MKEIHAILLSLLCLSGAEAFAQDARQLIEENPLRAAGALHAYEPLDTLFSAAPKGYEPFYISHFGRHGSRYHSSEKKFSVIETLKAYKEKGLLTPEGDNVLTDLIAVFEASDGKFGALTQRGAQEHKNIARRMATHYPAVFSKHKKIIAISTVKQRVQDSRDSFLAELTRLYPALEIASFLENENKRFDGAHQEVRGFSPLPEEKEYLATVSTAQARKHWTDSLDTSRKPLQTVRCLSSRSRTTLVLRITTTSSPHSTASRARRLWNTGR